MVMIGADIEELRLASRVFEQRASDIADHIEPSLGDAITRTTWLGIDADRFKSLWFSSLSPSLKSVAGELDKAAKTLRNNADAQEDTSAQGGRFAGASGVSGASSSAYDASGKSTRSKIERPPRQGTRGFRRDLMDLAGAAYDHTTGESHEKLIPNGWEEVSRDEMAKLGIERDKLGVYGDDFSATLFRNAEGRYVLAFKGSNDLKDWVSNGVGGLAKLISPQDLKAVEVAFHVRAMLRANGIGESDLVMTGHSLGGRLATVAATATGSEAVTFNSAGTSDAALLMAQKMRKDVLGEVGVGRSSPSVHNIVDHHDGLHYLRSINADAQLVGAVELVGAGQGSMLSNPIEKHMLDSLSRTYDIETWEQHDSYEKLPNNVA